MNQLRTLVVFIVLCLWNRPIQGQELPWNGVDVSDLTQVENGGAVFYDNNGVKTPVPKILANHGVKVARLRLWHGPKDGVNGLDYTLKLAQRLHDAGIEILLDFHFSYTWADPEKQWKPEVWKDLHFYNGLPEAVRDYVQTVAKEFIGRGIPLVGVQFGNETPSGMMWPDGRVGGDYDTNEQWWKLGELFKHAREGLEWAYWGKTLPKVVVHLNDGGNKELSKWFFNNLIAQGVEFDVIGVSFYPWWHGEIWELKENLEFCVKEFGKHVAVVETSYPWTLQWYDWKDNIVGSEKQLHKGYPATRAGQAAFLHDVKMVVAGLPNNRGLGVMYWAGTWVTTSTWPSSHENQALFDSWGYPNPALDVVKTAPANQRWRWFG
jgi:arabinogalactan endo-1,4-beta-galactosidase